MTPDLISRFDVRGKIAVVTGGGGILPSIMGAALAERGSRVAFVDIDGAKARAAAEAVGSSGGETVSFACDVLDEDGLTRAYKELCETWGSPDILVNGAGGNAPGGTTRLEFLERRVGPETPGGDFFSLDLEAARSTFDLNFFGTFLPTRVFSRGMVDKGGGAVLNIASMGALTPLTQVGMYSAAKAAVANFTAWLADHFAHTGVRVNALAPGFLMTEQLRFLHVDQATGQPTPRAKKVIAHTPLGRYGNPDELLGGMLYLVSEASSFVTGIVLPIDGGFSSYSI